jgi:hypothetical protein
MGLILSFMQSLGVLQIIQTAIAVLVVIMIVNYFLRRGG